jgi:hypothetical protein
MRNSSLILGGAAIFILGLLLSSDLVDWLIDLTGILAMIGGIVVFATGVYFTVKAKQ